MRRLAAAAAALALLGAAPARAADDPYCTATSYGDEPARAAPLRFGVDPELAGSVGTGQSQAVPLDKARDIAALHALTPPGKAMVLRVNRLFWADGEQGIERFRRIVGRHSAEGFDSELQVRYHPKAEDEGDIARWTAYVRHVVDVFGPDPHVVAMTITNEVNLNISQNTSDGAYDGATDALVQGIVAARDEADRIGRTDLPFGFTFAFRWNPLSDATFWTTLGAAPDAFRRALGFVGVDSYPGTFYPPVTTPPGSATGFSPGEQARVAVATVRECYMPKARLGAGVPIWITENGFQSGALGDDATQAAALREMVAAIGGSAATYGVTDYRWFNLRDNLTGSPGIFDTTGLLRDDYSEKPAFAAYRRLVQEQGVDAPPPPAARAAATARPGVVSLEFDDGTASQRRAVRLLDRHRLHATFYVNTPRIGRRGYLTWKQLEAMWRAGHEIGGHTLHHARLPGLSARRARHEVCADRRHLRARGFAAAAFAYPDGRASRRARRIVRRCGYTTARRGSGGFEAFPPRRPYATRVALAVLAHTPASKIVEKIREGVERGRWVQLLFHRVCARCGTYAVRQRTLALVVRWLATHPEIAVRTVSEVVPPRDARG